jgi:hypothetical protein
VQDALNAFRTLSDLRVSSPDMSDNVATVVSSLRELRACHKADARPSGPQRDTLTRLDNVLIPLWEAQRAMDVLGPFNPPANYIPPSLYDVVLTDVKEEDLFGGLSTVLGIAYLSDAPRLRDWPVQGKIWGHNNRCMMSLPVSANGKSVHVHFIVDTGAPFVYITEAVLEALGIRESDLPGILVDINGTRSRADVTPVKSHFRGLNILGMSYLWKINGLLKVDCLHLRCSLESQGA